MSHPINQAPSHPDISNYHQFMIPMQGNPYQQQLPVQMTIPLSIPLGESVYNGNQQSKPKLTEIIEKRMAEGMRKINVNTKDDAEIKALFPFLKKEDPIYISFNIDLANQTVRETPQIYPNEYPNWNYYLQPPPSNLNYYPPFPPQQNQHQQKPNQQFSYPNYQNAPRNQMQMPHISNEFENPNPMNNIHFSNFNQHSQNINFPNPIYAQTNNMQPQKTNIEPNNKVVNQYQGLNSQGLNQNKKTQQKPQEQSSLEGQIVNQTLQERSELQLNKQNELNNNRSDVPILYPGLKSTNQFNKTYEENNRTNPKIQNEPKEDSKISYPKYSEQVLYQQMKTEKELQKTSLLQELSLKKFDEDNKNKDTKLQAQSVKNQVIVSEANKPFQISSAVVPKLENREKEDPKIQEQIIQKRPNKIIKRSKLVKTTGKVAKNSKKRLEIKQRRPINKRTFLNKIVFKADNKCIKALPKSLEDVLIPIYTFNETKDEETDYYFPREQNYVNFITSNNTRSARIEDSDNAKIIKMNTRRVLMYWKKKSTNVPTCFKRTYFKESKMNKKDGIFIEIIDYSGKIIQVLPFGEENDSEMEDNSEDELKW